MRNMSKTLSTLKRLRRVSLPEYPRVHVTSLDMEQPQHVVDFNPEEIDDMTPLRPDEIDECQLAEFLNDHDISSLFETQNTSQSRKRKTPEHAHRIPEDHNDKENQHYISRGTKRTRIN